MTICNKNDFFQGGSAMPDCTNEAVNEVTVTLGISVIRPVCESCTPLITQRRSEATIIVVPIAQGSIDWSGDEAFR